MEQLTGREVVVGALLAIWFWCSVWVQFRGLKRFRLLRFDLFWLVTRYTFFAPEPRTVNGLVRLRPTPGPEAGAGEPVWRFASRTLTGVFWNPRRLPDFTFGRACIRAIRLCDRGEAGEPVEASLPFRRIMNVTRHAAFRDRVSDCVECELREVTAGMDESGASERIVHSTVLRVD